MSVSTSDNQRMIDASVAVVGGGAWGTALAALASARGPTTLWAREPEVVMSIREHHENRRFLSGFELPAGLRATTELEEALAGASIVIVAVPAQYMRAVMERAGPWLSRDALIVSVTKGIEVSSSKRMTQVLTEVLSPIDADEIGVLAGPNLAARSSRGIPRRPPSPSATRTTRPRSSRDCPVRRSASTRAPTSSAVRSAAP